MGKHLLLAALSSWCLLITGNKGFSQCSVNAGSNISICDGQSTTLTATVTHGHPNTFTWTSVPASGLPSGQSITVSPSTTTTYTVHASGGGCNTNASVVVTVNPAPAAPSFTFNPDNVCSGTTVTFTVTAQTGISYSWDFGDSTTGGGSIVTHTFNSYGSGTTSFTVTLTAVNGSGCSSSSTQTVTVLQTPAAILTPGADVDTVTFNGFLTFYQCAAAAQEIAFFTFINQATADTGLTYTIIWGDTGVPCTTTSAFDSVSHIYTRGIYNLTYIVSSGIGGCADTANYRVFFGSNPGGGIASMGNTDICGPGWLSFLLTNFSSNSPGTIYTVSFNDGTPSLQFNQPPPDSVAHYFQTPSCGVTSTDGANVFNNSYAVSLTIENPCGTTAASVLPIYVSTPPIADYAPPGEACAGTNNLYINTTQNGEEVSSTGCDNSTAILWSVIPDSGWTITTGSLGSNNGFIGPDFSPALWTSGSNTLGINFTSPGNYEVQLVAANNCGPDTIIKQACVSSVPSPSFVLASAGGSINGCAPLFDSVINMTPGAGTCSGMTYAWALNPVSNTCAPDSSVNYLITNGTINDTSGFNIAFYNQGVYNISLTAQNGCGTTTSSPQIITVNTAPQLALTTPGQTCIGQSFAPNANPLACGSPITNFSWSFPGGLPDSSNSQNPGNILYNTAGSYYIALSATNQCGTADTNALIVVDTTPVANAGGGTYQTCSGHGVQIGSAPVNGLNYSWTPSTGLSSTNIANPVATIINNGSSPITQTYYLTVSNLIGCSSTDSVTITVYPAATVNAGPDAGVCSGSSILLNGSFGGAATSATWTSNNGGTFSNANSPTSLYTPSISSGTITLTLTTNQPSGICPAASSTSIITVVSPPTANAGSNVSTCSGTPVQIGSPSQNGYSYNWSPATGLNSANIANPTVTLMNNTNGVIAQTYTLMVSAVGCSDTAQVTVSVYPGASANAGPAGSVCAGGTITLNGSISGAAASATWSSSSGTFSEADSLTTNFTPNITSGIAVVTLTTNQPSAFCPAATSTINITVNPVPSVTTNPFDQTTCSGTWSQNIQLTSNVNNATFSWTGLSPDGVTGYVSNGTSNTIPPQLLNNDSVSAGMVIFNIIPSAAGCSGSSVNDTIYVNPLISVNPIASQTICSGSGSQPVNPSSVNAGITFSWTAIADANMLGYTSSGAGNIPSQVITNSGNSMDSVEFTVTPSANGCNSTPVNFAIYVTPQAIVNVPAAQIICSGATTPAVNLTSNIGGASFSWTAAASAGISGFTTSGTGNIPAQTLANADTSLGKVIYTVTASVNGCTGPAAYYMVTVNPVPNSIALPSTDSVCTGTQTDITLSSDLSGATFNWTVNSPVNVSGASAGTGDSIQQTLTNSGQNIAEVTYYVMATTNLCPGPADSVSVLVMPDTTVQFSQPDQTICSGQTTQVVNISGNSTGVTFAWTAAANGVAGVQTSGTDSIPAQTLVNNGSATDTITYTIAVTNGGCPGQLANYKVMVSPQPSVFLPAPQTICGGNSTNPVVLSSNAAGTTFSWTGSSANGVTGFVAAGSSSIIPSMLLTDTSPSAAGTVDYIITSSLGGCNGAPTSYLITVNPYLTVNPLAPQSICSGASTQADTPTSATNGVSFEWKATAGIHIEGFAVAGSGIIPAQVLTNNTYLPDSVMYQITPYANGCAANPINFTITVKPLPDVNLPGAQGVCSGQPSDTVYLNSAVAGTTFSWTAAAPSMLSGFTPSGNGNIPPQTVINTDTITDTVTYTIIPVAAGCIGASADFGLNVKPAVTVNPSPATDSICNGTVADVTFTSGISGAAFNWTVNAPSGISGASSGSGNYIQQALVNNTSNSLYVTYIITPSANTCNGNIDSVNVWVKPVAAVQFASPDQVICSGQSTEAVTLSSPVSGATFSWTAQANGISGVIASGTSSIPAQTLTNSGNGADTVVYIVTASNGGCAGQTAGYNVMVNPGPNVNLPLAQTICSGASTDSVSLSSGVSGTTFSWAASSSTGATGFTSAGAGAVIPGQTLYNSTDSVANVVYTITPYNNNCTGPSAQYSVSINPLPDVITPPSQTICSGSATNVVNLTSIAAGVTYTWTSNASLGVSGNLASGAGNIPAQTLNNSTDLAGVVIYHITPDKDGCAGNTSAYMVTVNPSPTISFSPATQQICSGQSTANVVITSNTPGVSINWTATIPAGITGADSAGTSTIPSQLLYNNLVDTFPVPLTIQYNVQVTTTGTVCPGIPGNYAITVLPKPQIDFNISVNNGCSPLNVNVIPNTMNYGVPDSLVLIWGDGTAGEVLYPNNGKPEWQSLNHTFYNSSSVAKTFNVTITAQNGCFDTTVTHPVTVLPGKISAFFSVDAPTGCEPLAVTFHDESQGAGLLSWCFNYDISNDSCMGAGIVDSAGATVTHTYMAGTYTVALYATNGSGCAQDTAYQTITVTPSPVANFSTASVPCAASQISFTDQSTAPGSSFITAYDWQFGDGDSSIAENPQHIYNNFGNYNVCLTVTSSYGCSNTVCHPITISAKPILAFNFTNACVNQQSGQFTTQSSGADFFTWNFGDGTTASGSTAYHDYASAGTYTVTLIGSSGTCSDTISQPVIIYPIPVAAFLLTDTFSCGLPSTVQMINTSTGAIGYYWDFGNGTGSTDANPAAIYNALGAYTISLVASNQYNCFDTTQKGITIYPNPEVQAVTVNPAQGCKPLNVEFFANGTNINEVIWNFGDGTTATTTVPFTSHLYADSGLYTVQLTVYSYGVCTNTIVLPDTVTVHGIPTADFEYILNESGDDINGTVQFVNESLNATSFVWNFGDNIISTEVNPSHLYANTDQFQVMLIAYNAYGCADTAQKDVSVIKKSLYVPNAFAPDYSGVSNLVREWKPAGMGLSTYHAQVFDKWGELLWESTALTPDLQPAEGWDGTYQGKMCQQDVYVWKIDASFIDGTLWTGMSYPKEPEKKTIGSVTLIR